MQYQQRKLRYHRRSVHRNSRLLKNTGYHLLRTKHTILHRKAVLRSNRHSMHKQSLLRSNPHCKIRPDNCPNSTRRLLRMDYHHLFHKRHSQKVEDTLWMGLKYLLVCSIQLRKHLVLPFQGMQPRLHVCRTNPSDYQFRSQELHRQWDTFSPGRGTFYRSNHQLMG